MRSLWTAASGMHAQQFNIDTISHNLSNVNTTGFKGRADFEDLLYQKERLAGTPSSLDTQVPTGIRSDTASRWPLPKRCTARAPAEYREQARYRARGRGLFRSSSMTEYRIHPDGAFKVDSNGQVVTHNGYRLEPP